MNIRKLINELESELNEGREKEYFEIHKERFYFILIKKNKCK